MPKTTLIDCCIKKQAYREVAQILGIHGCDVIDRNTHECDILGTKAEK